MKLASYQTQNKFLLIILSLLFAMGISYRFNSAMDEHAAVDHPLETFSVR